MTATTTRPAPVPLPAEVLAAPRCADCKDTLGASDRAAGDGLCWRCAQDRDWIAEREQQRDLAHGLG